MPDVQLHIEGKLYGGWKEISLTRSLDIFANTFDLTLTDNQASQARTVKLGSPCQVRIDGETLITGYVDRIRPRYDGRSRSLTVSGRSKTADLVDCSVPATVHNQSQQNNQTLLAVAKRFAKLLGIVVSSTVETSPVLVSAIAEGETVFEYLETLARQQGVRLVTDPAGDLVITRASMERVGTALVLGENIEEAEGAFSHRDRFSHYYVTGRRLSRLIAWMRLRPSAVPNGSATSTMAGPDRPPTR